MNNIFKRTLILFILATCMQTAFAQDSIAHGFNTSNVRMVPDSIVEKLKSDREFIYANDSSYWREEKRSQESAFEKFIAAVGRSRMLKWVLYVFLASVIIFTIYQVIVVNDFFIFSRRRSKGSAAGVHDDFTFSENLDEKINQSISQEKYREAIRFMYLKTLKTLSDKKIIQLHARSTNQDFVRQMYKHDQLGQFRRLTRIYEYVWYGEFEPSLSQFEIVRTNFNQFNSVA